MHIPKSPSNSEILSEDIQLIEHSDTDPMASTLASDLSSRLSISREPLPQHAGPLKPTKKDKFTILVIGETGSGKTAFVDLLINLLRGNGPFELQEYHDKRKESGLSKTQSQTSKATLYEATSLNGTRFEILDTPGLADTRGLEQDAIHKEEINNAIQRNITSIDAVIIMTNGTVERLTFATDYTLNIISSMFPHSVLDNIGIVLTNTDPLSSNFDSESLQPELRGSPLWEIQNPLALFKKYQARVNRFTPMQHQQHQDRIKACYDITVQTFNSWLEWLDDRLVQPTLEIDRLYRISTDLESHIEGALAAMSRLSEQRAQYTRIISDLQDAEEAKNGLERLKTQMTVPVWDREPTEKYNTICITPGCHKNCHSPCNLNFTEDHTSLGRWCFVFKTYWRLPSWDGGLAECTVCKHPSKDHRHYRQVHVRTVQEGDLEKLIQRLEDATTEKEGLEDAKIAAESKLVEIQENMTSAQDTIRALVDSYNEASLSRSFAGHIRSIIDMLKLRKEELRTKAGTDDELLVIEKSIKEFEKKLQVLAANGTGWTRMVKDMLETGRYRVEGEPKHDSVPGGSDSTNYGMY